MFLVTSCARSHASTAWLLFCIDLNDLIFEWCVNLYRGLVFVCELISLVRCQCQRNATNIVLLPCRCNRLQSSSVCFFPFLFYIFQFYALFHRTVCFRLVCRFCLPSFWCVVLHCTSVSISHFLNELHQMCYRNEEKMTKTNSETKATERLKSHTAAVLQLIRSYFK